MQIKHNSNCVKPEIGIYHDGKTYHDIVRYMIIVCHSCYANKFIKEKEFNGFRAFTDQTKT